MTDGNENGCVRNYDGARGADVLERLETVLRNTPPHALATPPLLPWPALPVEVGGVDD